MSQPLFYLSRQRMTTEIAAEREKLVRSPDIVTAGPRQQGYIRGLERALEVLTEAARDYHENPLED